MAILGRHAMTTAPKTANADMNAADAAGLMRSFDTGMVPIVDEDGRLQGLVTDRDLAVRVVAERVDPTRVRLRDIMTREVETVSPDQSLAEAREFMAERRIRRLPVLKGEELVGVLSLGDVAVAASSDRATGEALEAISTSASTQPDASGPDRGTPERTRSEVAR
jgi:CBS domain-containing protein